MRRAAGTVAGCAVLVVTLAGCVVDQMPSGPYLSNDSAENVLVHVVGTERVETIRADGGRYVEVDGCEGTSLRLEQEDGDVLAEYDGGLCPGMTVAVRADGTVTVHDDDGDHTLAPPPTG